MVKPNVRHTYDMTKAVSVTLKEESAESDTHVGCVSLMELGAKVGDTVTSSYGNGW